MKFGKQPAPVVDIDEDTLEVHKPVTRPDGLVNMANTGIYAYTGQLVVMPGVVDVFERPNLTAAHGP